MTTTQTGGGNGAAPDGGSVRQPRIAPTRPGWWWCSIEGMPWHPRRVEVSGMGRLMIKIAGCGEAVESPILKWLVLIPGFAVLAALAEYGEALVACYALAAPEDYEDDTAMLTFEACRDARRALDAAIRAERDAERDGGA